MRVIDTEGTTYGPLSRFLRFDSTEEVLERLEKYSGRRKGRDHNDDWAGGSWSEAWRLATHGWSGPRAEVRQVADKIIPDLRTVTVPAFRFVHDVEGAVPDVAAFLSGEPENMVQTILAEVPKPGRVVAITLGGVVSGTFSAYEIQQRGSAVVALVEALEYVQVSTEVFVDFSVRGASTYGKSVPLEEKNTWSACIKVKGASDKLDVDQLMYWCAHPSALRRMGFALQEMESAEVRREYGFDSTMTGEGGAGYSPAQAGMVQANVVLDGMLSGSSYRSTTVEEWVRKYLDEFGLLMENA